MAKFSVIWTGHDQPVQFADGSTEAFRIWIASSSGKCVHSVGFATEPEARAAFQGMRSGLRSADALAENPDD